ncbi:MULTISPECIES: L-fucose:H+ symporter permease [Clostridium]|uniref:L-fucose:H+ symporter permease n=1 Tax=Clostridium botulinum TaxID=1491 RepID=A0A6B4JGY5_CLOBO|nr:MULTISPECIES: L-fucose:H+ symporter permease [Clostridium]EES51048.1 L-fucose:H+ symporter permease [Clostridium botulinum E1 str. 'BoNT E Beluga']MBN1036652.1 L-fucose:H+ symporter permease [Clostridium botulinum]MBN1043345.1 L-fucose:H+ symporter permease [Clostridium botulinum]MBY6759517.1 L-fucose:H+ symporter permease [Clostridium botulinum]MBY6837744.1 L-fucose:H+ symporter permease [Clostridium botulinum]
MSMKNIKQYPDGYLSKTPIFQYILLSLLFPLWAAAASLNDILITQFKSVFELSDFASAFVQSAFYGGYFLIAIPASLVIKKSSYRTAILTGLSFYVVGCFLFYPSSHMATYSMFLAAIFVLAIGLSFLETSANTYSSMIGPKDKATLRLNISQTFYPIGSIIGVLLGKYLIFQDGESLQSQMSKMTPEAAKAFGESVLQHTLQPYRYLILILIVVLILFAIIKFPTCKPKNVQKEVENEVGILETLKYLMNNANFKKGIIAEFFYVGMQTTVWSFTIRLALTLDKSINERNASTFMVYSFIAFFIGKVVANFLMNKFNVTKVLLTYSVLGFLFLVYVTLTPNITSVYAAIAVSFLFGPCWATIYSKTLDSVEDKKYTETAGAIIVMAIIGGAVIPTIQGLVSDFTGSMQLSFIIPTICFALVAVYFYSELKRFNVKKGMKNNE